MIYSINNEPITLYGEAADKFLESIGVELYEGYVVIDENTFLGADGEAILNENGIHLYEDHIVLEGNYAKDFAKKTAEKTKAITKRMFIKAGEKTKDILSNSVKKIGVYDDDNKRNEKAKKKYEKDQKKYEKDQKKWDRQEARKRKLDEREIRKQLMKSPKNESTIFGNIDLI